LAAPAHLIEDRPLDRVAFIELDAVRHLSPDAQRSSLLSQTDFDFLVHGASAAVFGGLICQSLESISLASGSMSTDRDGGCLPEDALRGEACRDCGLRGFSGEVPAR